MKKQKGETGKALSRVAAIGLAGAVLCCGGIQAEAAAQKSFTLKDLFDEHYYADTYKDLKELFGYDREALWNHYVQCGLNEGRGMSELFDVVKYREQYKDLDTAFGDNWDAYANHFLTLGMEEGRNTGTGIEFNAADYAARYPDVKAAYGDDVLALWKHYQTSGAEEHREARSEETVQEEIEAELEAEEEEDQQPETSGGRTERIDKENGGWVIVEYDENDIEVKSTTYDKDGNMLSYSIPEYENGRLVSSILHFSNGRYAVNEYNENGKQVKATWYDKDGKMSQVNDYTTSPMTALHYKYDENGTLTSIRKTSGIGRNPKLLEETFYDADGHIEHFTTYKNEKPLQETFYNKDGKLWKERFYDNAGKLRRETFYDKNGSKEYNKVYTYNEDGTLSGTESWNADGTKRQEP